MLGLCQYRDIFGRPGQGAHSYRFLGFAIVDTIATILLVIIVSYLFGLKFIKTLLIFFAIGQLLHIVFCVNTTFINNVLGLHFN